MISNPIASWANTAQKQELWKKIIENIPYDRWVLPICTKGLTWQFPCRTRRWVWLPGGYTGSCGYRFSPWRQRSWVTFLWSPQQASSHIVQLKEKKAQLINSAKGHTTYGVFETREPPYSPASCPGRCSAAAGSTGSGFGAAYWWRTPRIPCTCTPGSSWCYAWRIPCSPHSWPHHSDALRKARGTFGRSIRLCWSDKMWPVKELQVSYLRPYRHIQHSIPQSASRDTGQIPLSQTGKEGEHKE